MNATQLRSSRLTFSVAAAVVVLADGDAKVTV
jgi:hypothetical protein